MCRRMEYIMRFVKTPNGWFLRVNGPITVRLANISACLKHARAHGVQRAEFVMFNKGTSNVCDLA